jgi:hypothetical protein
VANSSGPLAAGIGAGHLDPLTVSASLSKNRAAIRPFGRRILIMLNIVERPPTTVLGLHLRTLPMSPEIPEIWRKFVARINDPNSAVAIYLPVRHRNGKAKA